jgi:hypothetical protein
MLYITELFYNLRPKIDLIRNIRNKYGREFVTQVIQEFQERKDYIFEKKQFYYSLLSKDSGYLINLNMRYYSSLNVQK